MEYRAVQPCPDLVIVGAGVIGLSLALEVQLRGAQVLVLERGQPMAQASSAAAGMLAAEDPHNPLELTELSALSASLYPDFLHRIEEISGLRVPFQTDRTVQTFPDGTTRELSERSIDPRQLAPALSIAAKAAGAQIVSPSDSDWWSAQTESLGQKQLVVYATGAWDSVGLPVTPRKGQMLRVRIPTTLNLECVHRSEHIYVVPRTAGPQAGTALIGATIQDAGFDKSTDPASLAELRTFAAALVPGIADENSAPMVEAWAGLRPATPDGLPILGELRTERSAEPHLRHFVATGHFRNGILLAPATAKLIADLIEHRTPAVSLDAFSPGRFACAPVRM